MNIQSKTSAFASKKDDNISAFSDHLAARGLFDPARLKESYSKESISSASSAFSLRQLWKSTDLSSHDFANEVATFFGLRRVTFLELAEFRSLADRFAPRFLREASIFPFETGDGAVALAAGDPADEEALQAAGLFLGGRLKL